MRTLSFRLLIVSCLAVGCFDQRLEAAEAAFTWDQPDSNSDGSHMDNLAGYRFYYGTTSQAYSSTVDVGLATGASIINLAQGQTYFFAVSAYNSNGNESPLAGELTWTSPAALPIPPNITQAKAGGIPPVIALVMYNNSLRMGIWGTVGADIMIQNSTNLANPLAWESLDVLLLTNAAPSSNGAPQAIPQNALEAAYIPAFEWFTPPVPAASPYQFFRVVMPYNYAILADRVLNNKGYQTRLIVIRLPGETLHDVCYVGEDQAYIDCNDERFVMALNYSGATLREIADNYGGFVSMNWTSASEFVFSDGVRQLGATVVKTDSPASDPLLAISQTTSIVVNF